MKNKLVFITGGLVAVVALAFGVFFATAAVSGNYSLAEIKVQNLSCGSCVATIMQAFSGNNGVGQIDVDVTSGRARVEFDASKTDAAQIASVISAAGYPATPEKSLTAQEYQSLKTDSDQLAEKYVARIGERLISREEFNARVAARRAPGQSPELDFQLRPSVWQQMMQQELLLVDASRNGVVVQDGEVELELKQMREKFPKLDAYVSAEFGSFDAFVANLKTTMIIDRNIERNVLKGETDQQKQRELLNQWYSGLVAQVPVEIYDNELKTAGAGGCGSGGGSCCSTPQG